MKTRSKRDEYFLSEEVYEHKNGLKYLITWSYDEYNPSPLEMGDCGVVDHMQWDPTDEGALEEYLDQYNVGLEEEARLRLMRALRPYSRREGSGLFYDYLSSLNKAHTEWGFTDHDAAVKAVEADFDWLTGWYNDDWHWIALRAAPIDPDTDEVQDDLAQYVGGFESTILNDTPEKLVWKNEAINEAIAEVEWMRKNMEHPMQLSLNFA